MIYGFIVDCFFLLWWVVPYAYVGSIHRSCIKILSLEYLLFELCEFDIWVVLWYG